VIVGNVLPPDAIGPNKRLGPEGVQKPFFNHLVRQVQIAVRIHPGTFMGHEKTMPIMLNTSRFPDEPARNHRKIQPLGNFNSNSSIIAVGLFFSPSVELDMADRQVTVV
jgi:hypothetical protein